MNDIIVRYQKMPLTVYAYTATDENDDYNVYINTNIGVEEQEKAKQHELAHITNDHCFDCETVENCELRVCQA